MIFLEWLVAALSRIVIRFIAVVAGLQALNYVIGGDDQYKQWALANQGEIVIALALIVVMGLIYEWLRDP
ncbi:hypothetical protein [Methylobacterium oxalidis]|uniref:Uncharacterized protein n=1 Tax=Methylobacterium oxalidis TaxID=944322 RepID=A0A512IZ29_9HYPH|nr:hypothetical protein [Methylobacterium oxalidis]GEP02964.1 hypothetical protein MOX02_10020 [Methylobacterium oxalidis]GJE30250.1 hypothetical protein LDDCCGHA_0415 [Methylobacterium oxalidis]GLS65897.1 hypothetical protein GCM10007888_42790 [Methylobacterium oxalidis]